MPAFNTEGDDFYGKRISAGGRERDGVERRVKVQQEFNF